MSRRMTMDELTALHEEANEALSKDEHIHTPAPGRWCLRWSDVDYGPFGTGVTLEFWFDSREKFLDFFQERFFAVCVHQSKRGDLKLNEQVHQVVQEVRGGTLSREASMDRINALLKGRVQIEWWGSFEELCHSDDPYCLALREEFRDPGDEAEEGEADALADLDPARPVEEGEMEDFLEFVEMNGVP